MHRVLANGHVHIFFVFIVEELQSMQLFFQWEYLFWQLPCLCFLVHIADKEEDKFADGAF